eukprot:TRINITY_DN10002_c0_g1_i2.p1 TRINITY_DN10002_c0_g1~~TRINITY_DN10002_c0_g1_i2.p1  ORF type:complete len:185 (-),score=11.08 TRINITY_DN10002_c0_g1_i2:62-616(-)
MNTNHCATQVDSKRDSESLQSKLEIQSKFLILCLLNLIIPETRVNYPSFVQLFLLLPIYLPKMSSKILVLNAGSSSLKFQLFDYALKAGLVSAVGGLVERIGEETSRLVFKQNSITNGRQSQPYKVETKVEDHTQGLKYVIDYLRDNVSSTIQQEVKAVGHRVVHGGNMTSAAVLDGKVLEEFS